MIVARRTATRLDRAVVPAITPDHSRRFINGLSVIVDDSIRWPGDDAWRRDQPVADDLDDHARRPLELGVGDRLGVEDPAGEHLLDRPVEGLGGELGGDPRAELAAVLGGGDDRRDPSVGVADLLQVGATERVRGAGEG